MRTTKRKRAANDEGGRVRHTAFSGSEPSARTLLSPASTTCTNDEVYSPEFTPKSVYQSAKLDFMSREIRLVQLVKNPDTHIIRLRFCKRSFEEKSEYTALSYTWGDVNPTREIFLDDQVFEVRENLWQFLYQARKHGWHRLFWIDAICIDQSNTKERNHQVSLMQTIYSEAVQVAVWLGPTADHSDLAMDHFNHEFYQEETPKRSLPLWEVKVAEAILELCQREYWRRIWIVQEIVLGKELIIYCGAKSLPGQRLNLLFEELDRLAGDREWIFHRLVHESDAASIIRQRGHWHREPTFTGFGLLELLNAHKFKACSDSRDRIYGLLSLTRETQIALLHITADYTKSAPELYQQIMNAYCEVYQPNRTEAESLARTLFDIFKFSPMEGWIKPYLKDLSSRVRTELEENWESYQGASEEKNCISLVLVEKEVNLVRY